MSPFDETATTVRDLAARLRTWRAVEKAVRRLSRAGARRLLRRVAILPVRPSRSLTSLGAFVSKGRRPVCIRLQFAQEPALLRDTFLHEVAHALDLLSGSLARHGGRPHGEGWQQWATELGAVIGYEEPSRALQALRSRRERVVGRCTRCGHRLKRLRALDRRSTYLHIGCGGRFEKIG